LLLGILTQILKILPETLFKKLVAVHIQIYTYALKIVPEVAFDPKKDFESRLGQVNFLRFSRNTMRDEQLIINQ
jgi:hypothetical protein